MGPKQNGNRKDLMDKLWASKRPISLHYNVFEEVGHFPVQQLARNVDPDMIHGSLFSRLDSDIQESITQLAGDFVLTKSCERTLDLSVRKMDVQPVYEFEKCPLFAIACSLTAAKYNKALTQKFMSPDEILQDLDLNKAPGFFETWRGFRTKLDCVVAGVLEEYNSLDMLEEIPIWKVSGKEEIKLRSSYVGDRKQRTFIIEPFNLLYHHKRIYGNQSYGMKGVGWSAYGFNPYGGGTDSLAQILSVNRRFWEWDVKGYDRVFPHLRYVYDIKNQCLVDDLFKRWVTDNNVESYLVLPNGDVIFKTWGNNSGSGTTTVDNIIGMDIIINHAFLRMGVRPEDISKYVLAFIFGDDVIGSDNWYVSDETFRDIMVSTFALYGYSLDPFIISKQIEGMSFLGFKFKLEKDFYIPKYDISRLAFSFANVESSKVSLEKELQKQLSLMMMSTGNGEIIYNKFRDAVLQVLVRTTCETAERIKQFGLHCIPMYDEALSWFSGLESKLGLEEVVGTKFVYYE